MRKSLIIIAAIAFNISLFSCTAHDLSEDIEIGELVRTGEDGDILPPEEDD